MKNDIKRTSRNQKNWPKVHADGGRFAVALFSRNGGLTEERLRLACAGLQKVRLVYDVEGAALRAQRAAAPADRPKRKALRYGGGDPLARGRRARFSGGAALPPAVPLRTPDPLLWDRKRGRALQGADGR